MTFLESLIEDYSQPSFGEGNPIKIGNYNHWIKKYADGGFSPLIYQLEQMNDVKDFPVENVTKIVKDVDMGFPEEYRQLIYNLTILEEQGNFMNEDRTLTSKAKILIEPYKLNG